MIPAELSATGIPLRRLCHKPLNPRHAQSVTPVDVSIGCVLRCSSVALHSVFTLPLPPLPPPPRAGLRGLYRQSDFSGQSNITATVFGDLGFRCILLTWSAALVYLPSGAQDQVLRAPQQQQPIGLRCALWTLAGQPSALAQSTTPVPSGSVSFTALFTHVRIKVLSTSKLESGLSLRNLPV